MSEQIGRVLDGRYRLVAPIGTGASATVYLADDVRLRRRVAVKILHPNLADDEQFLRRFQGEAQAAAALNDPHVMAVYDWGRGEVPYLVTEYLGGGSLRGVLDQGDTLTLSQALLVGLQATRGLEYAHRRGFVHRDIKPANLLFGDDERLRIADFGLARALAEAGWTEPGTMLGTVRYASPEQAKGGQVEPKSDVYSLGLTLIEAISGDVPFASDTTIATLMARVDTPVELDRDQFGPLRPVLERACRPDPADRPDAGELAVSFMAAAESLPRPQPIPFAGALKAGADTDDAQVLDVTNLAPIVDPAARAPAGTGGASDDAPRLSTRQQRKVDRQQARVDSDRPRRRWPSFLLGFLVVAAIGAGVAYAYTAMQPAMYEVEDFTGLYEADVRDLVADYGWDVVVRQERQTDSTVGAVLRQEPEPGIELEEGPETIITIYVSIGNDTVTLPTDLVGLPSADVAARLEELNLVVGEPIHEANEELGIDHVIRIQPGDDIPEGAPLAERDTVHLVVSSGPLPRTLPDVPVGTTYADMAELLEADGLVPTRGEASSETIAEGYVIRLDPASGQLVERGDTVRVIVSTGLPMVPVPDVRGLSESSAGDVLEADGFFVGDRIGPARRRVTGTDPAIGTLLRKGSTVNILTG
jgi:eukaryotic-like serine/threonine-protein kinase